MSESGQFEILALPYKKIVEVKNKKEFKILAEYIFPYTFVWSYSNLKSSFLNLALKHEICHVILRGSPFIEKIKIKHLYQSPFNKKQLELLTEEMEGLAIVNAILEAIYIGDWNTLETLKEFLTTHLARVFVALSDFIAEKATATELWDLLRRIYMTSCFVRDKKNGEVIHPTIVIFEMWKRFKEKNPEKINLDIVVRLFSELFRERGWIEGSPRHLRTVYSLGWALLFNSEVSNIALRNFFEAALWIPISVCFGIDTNTFMAKRMRTIDMIPAMKILPEETPSTSLGQFVYELTEKVKISAERMKSDFLGEERFLLYELPKVASTYVRAFVSDFKAENPQFFPKDAWKTIAARRPLERESLGEFMNDYDQKTFENLVKERMQDALNYPEDCCSIAEKLAKEAYEKLGDAAKILFKKTP